MKYIKYFKTSAEATAFQNSPQYTFFRPCVIFCDESENANPLNFQKSIPLDDKMIIATIVTTEPNERIQLFDFSSSAFYEDLQNIDIKLAIIDDFYEKEVPARRTFNYIHADAPYITISTPGRHIVKLLLSEKMEHFGNPFRQELPNLVELILPTDAIDTVGSYDIFNATYIQKLTFGPHFTEFYNDSADYTQLQEITFLSTTPPTIDDTHSEDTDPPLRPCNPTIYVPDAAVNTYKTAPRWQAWADKIKPLSEKPIDSANNTEDEEESE